MLLMIKVLIVIEIELIFLGRNYIMSIIWLAVLKIQYQVDINLPNKNNVLFEVPSKKYATVRNFSSKTEKKVLSTSFCLINFMLKWK